jgi:hypothetical protein
MLVRLGCSHLDPSRPHTSRVYAAHNNARTDTIAAPCSEAVFTPSLEGRSAAKLDPRQERFKENTTNAKASNSVSYEAPSRSNRPPTWSIIRPLSTCQVWPLTLASRTRPCRPEVPILDFSCTLRMLSTTGGENVLSQEVLDIISPDHLLALPRTIENRFLLPLVYASRPYRHAIHLQEAQRLIQEQPLR